MCGNSRTGCISRSEKGKVYSEDGTCLVIARVRGVRAVATIAGPIVSTRLTIIDHITHLWLITVDPITYLCHSTTMQIPHMGLVCVWIFTHDVKWYLRESILLSVSAGLWVCVF